MEDPSGSKQNSPSSLHQKPAFEEARARRGAGMAKFVNCHDERQKDLKTI